MLNVTNFLSQAQRAFTGSATGAAQIQAQNAGSNPFMNYNGNSIATYKPVSYARNLPVRGGYFAGYHNGRQNIVGQRLFIEI